MGELGACFFEVRVADFAGEVCAAGWAKAMV
jgi:hypothetical protein